MSILIYIATTVLFITGIIAIYLAAFMVVKSRSFLSNSIVLMGFLAAIYTIGYAFEINTTLENRMVFWNYIQYLALPFMPMIWIFLTYYLTQQKKPPKLMVYPTLFIAFSVFIARYTNVFHNLYYREMFVNEINGILLLALIKGPLYHIYSVYVVGTIVIASWYFYRFSKRYGGDIGKIARRMLWVALIPFFGFLINISPLGAYGIDSAAFLYPFSVILLVSIIHKEHFVDLKPYVRNKLFDESPNAVLLFNDEHQLLDFNRRANALFVNIENYKHQTLKTIQKYYPFIKTTFDSNEEKSNVIHYQTKHYRIKQFSVNNSLGLFVGMFIEFTDITEEMTTIQNLEKQKAQIQFLSYHDALTKTKNRYYLEYCLTTLKKSDHPIGMVYVDLNDLKYINDNFGHQQGDAVLKRAAKVLMEHTEDKGFVVRLGGDEFLMMIKEASMRDLEQRIQAIQETIKKDKEVSLSMGSTLKNFDDNFELKYKEAEDRMYANKKVKN